MINSPLNTKSFIKKNIWIVVAYNILLIIFTASAKSVPGINGFDILLTGYSVVFAIIHSAILLYCFLLQNKEISFRIIFYTLLLLITSLFFWWIYLPLIIIYIVYRQIKHKDAFENFSFKTFAYITLAIIILNFIFMLLNFLLNFVIFNYLYSHNLF
jgi:hypothetical protein